MRKIAAMVIMIVMILPVLCVLSVNDTKAENVKADVGSGEFVDITLYLHNDSTLDTIEPTSENVTIKKLKDGAFDFKTESLLTNLNVSGVNITIEFWVDLYFVLGKGIPPKPGSANVTLTFSVYDSSEKIGSVSWTKKSGSITGIWAYTTPSEPETVQIDLSSWDEKQFKNTVKLVIAPTIDTTNEQEDMRRADFYYDSTDYPSKLRMSCAPVKIDVSTYYKNYTIGTEFMPNLAAEDCIIKFRSSKSGEDSIKNAFGDDDITEVNIEIRGPKNFYCKPENNITENKTKEELYKWGYSDYRSQFVADKPYTATITVKTVQHTFTQTTSFNFSAYGLEAKIDKSYETITAGNQTDYTIIIRNTGSFPEPPGGYTGVSVKVNIEISPRDLHTWNISLADKSIETNTTGSFTHEFFNFKGGDTKSLVLTAKSLNVIGEVGDDWNCRVDIVVDFTEDDEKPKMLSSWTYLAPPHKIDINWAKALDDPYYVLVDVESCLYVNVTNMGSLSDTVDLTLNYTNDGVWDIAFKNGQKNTTTKKLNPYRYTLGGYEEKVELIIIASSEGENEATTSVNITACSQGNKSVRDYLTLNLSRAFGITMDVELKGTGEVDVKDSNGEAFYEISIKTNDNTTHTVDLKAICDDKNITTIFNPTYVKVSKDSTENVTLTVTCVKGMLAGSYTITVNASIRGAPVSKHNKTANVIVTVNEYYALSVVWAESNKNNITVTAAPGEYFYRTLRVTNKGNSNISVSIDPVNVHDFQLFDSAVPSQFSLSYGEEKNVTIYLYIPKDARDGDTFVVHMETSGAGSPKSAVITIEIKQDIWEKLIATLYSMIYFIILLIAVVVVFISVWVKKKKMR